MKHTELPWYIQEYNNYNGFSIMHDEFGCVAERWEEIYKEDRAKQMKANAAFICHAVNNHYKLVEALKKCRHELVEELKELGGCDHSVGMCFCPIRYAIEHADAALASATGGDDDTDVFDMEHALEKAHWGKD